MLVLDALAQQWNIFVSIFPSLTVAERGWGLGQRLGDNSIAQAKFKEIIYIDNKAFYQVHLKMVSLYYLDVSSEMQRVACLFACG